MTRARLVALALACMIACKAGPAGPASSGSPTPCPSPTPTSGTASFLKEFPLTDWGELTAFEAEGKYATATLLSSQSVIELHPQIARAVIDSRFKIIGADNEGFESEIYFARKERFYGAFRLRNGPCEGRVTVRLLFLLKPGGSSI